MAMIPVLRDKTLRGYPKHASGGKVEYRLLADTLRSPHPTDAHFAAYSVPATPRRLTLDALGHAEFGDGIPMVAAIFDVDCESSHKASGAKSPAPAPDDWWLAEQSKLEVLLERHRGGFVYRTRGGYRIVNALEGVVLREPADASSWTTRYIAWVAYLRRVFGIHADPSCNEWNRLFRLPFVVRDGRREAGETIGDAAAIGVWACEPSPEDYALSKKLKKPKKPRSYKAPEEREVASVGEGLLFHAFKARDQIGGMVDSTTWTVRCPWESEHSKGEAFDSSTVLFAPLAGEALGWLHCSHGHCTGRRLGDVLALFTDEELAAARERAGLPPRPGVDEDAVSTPADETVVDPPSILLGPDEHRVGDEAIAALAQLPGLYQRGVALVDVVDVDGRKVIRELPQPRVRELLAHAARWVKVVANAAGEPEERATHPPEWCVRAVMSRGSWERIPRLVGLLQVPALRPDGSVIQDAGLDAKTGFLFSPAVEFLRVADQPTQADAIQARDELLEVVRDFPFATKNHLAAWLAFLLTPFARPAFDGCVPLTAVDATTRGTGKGRLVDATTTIVTGHDASKMPQPKDDEETRKRITSVLREGETIQVIDNVSRRVEDASLDACLTTTFWKDRALGKNETIGVPNLTMWVVTGNNLEFGGDTARRTLHIRLESSLENPEDRDDFAHPDLLGWVRRERPRLVCAALTILRAYVVAGRPAVSTKPWGSFEAWSQLIGNAVEWVGLPNPQATRVELEAVSDTRKASLVAVLAGWDRLAPEGLTARAAIEALYPLERLRGQAGPDGFSDLREAIEALVPTQPGKQPSSNKLAYQLRHFKRRVVGGRMFDSIEDRNGVAKWVVVTRKTAGDQASKTSSPAHPPHHPPRINVVSSFGNPATAEDAEDQLESLRVRGGTDPHIHVRTRTRRDGGNPPHPPHPPQAADPAPPTPGSEAEPSSTDEPGQFSAWLAANGISSGAA